jgi:hypothetical protein
MSTTATAQGVPTKSLKDDPKTSIDTSKDTDKQPGEEKKVLPQMRRIVIETDGNKAIFTKLEVAGNLELLGILQGLIDAIKKN